jgi:LysM repeat protein
VLVIIIVVGVVLFLPKTSDVFKGNQNPEPNFTNTNEINSVTSAVTPTVELVTTKTLVPAVLASGTRPLVYVVRSGDVLLRIAQTYGTSVEALMAANRFITNKSVIRVGWRLVVPVNNPGFRGNGTFLQANQTLQTLAAANKVSLQELLLVNHLNSADELKVGDPVLLPR